MPIKNHSKIQEFNDNYTILVLVGTRTMCTKNFIGPKNLINIKQGPNLEGVHFIRTKNIFNLNIKGRK
jgi:hypothetical protein